MMTAPNRQKRNHLIIRWFDFQKPQQTVENNKNYFKPTTRKLTQESKLQIKTG